MQIVQELQNVLGTKDVACVIDAKHLCNSKRNPLAQSLLNLAENLKNLKLAESFGLY
jgi:GTP cyclohydrolase I